MKSIEVKSFDSPDEVRTFDGGKLELIETQRSDRGSGNVRAGLAMVEILTADCQDKKLRGASLSVPPLGHTPHKSGRRHGERRQGRGGLRVDCWSRCVGYRRPTGGGNRFSGHGRLWKGAIGASGPGAFRAENSQRDTRRNTTRSRRIRPQGVRATMLHSPCVQANGPLHDLPEKEIWGQESRSD